MSYQKNKNLNLCIILKLLDEAACFKREARVANRNSEDELKITFGIFVFIFFLFFCFCFEKERNCLSRLNYLLVYVLLYSFMLCLEVWRERRVERGRGEESKGEWLSSQNHWSFS